jgi:hypothetical protein
MFVQPNEVLPHRPLPILNNIALCEVLKPIPQPADRRDVELILMRLQVAQLSEMLSTLVQLAGVGFRCRVNDFVSSHISVLGESLAADIAMIRSLACVPSLVSFEVPELAEALTTVGLFAEEGFDAGVDAGVDVEVGLLAKGFVAAGDGAFVLLF